MWNIFQLAKTYTVRPSVLMDITTPYDAFCFDQAVAEVGNTITGELENIEAKSKGEHQAKVNKIFKQYFDQVPHEKTQQFRTITAPTK